MQANGETYMLKAKFDNIGGLKARSAVKVGGVTVGRVESIALDEDDFTPVVTLAISKDYDSFPDTTSVAILTSGLLGEQYIGLQPGFSFGDVENLGHGDFIEDTKSALVLEDLIGQFLFSRDSE
jgi:phospholipid/cholesterol/gamma-HCH transport system substrate-binding protein